MIQCLKALFLRNKWYETADVIRPVFDGQSISEVDRDHIELNRQAPEYQEALNNYRNHRSTCGICKENRQP